MKYRLAYIILLLSLATTGALAQYSISGTLIDKDKDEPLGHATVQLFCLRDSSFVKGVTSSAKGYFMIGDVSAGSYRLVVSFIGLARVEKIINVNNASLNMGRIVLGAGDNYLDEVVVKGVAAQVSVTNDTLEYNAVAFKVTQNAVAEDILKKMPGIEVDAEGKIFVNGEEVKKVRINGKRFFGESTQMATKNVPADLIDKIQIIDEQSEMAKLTGFEDAETTKMINITIREDKSSGIFANLYGGYGGDDRYETNGIINRISGDNVATVVAGSNNTNNSRFEGIGEVSVNIPGMRISKNQMTRGITTSDMIGANVALDLKKNMKLEANYAYGSPSTSIRQKAGRETSINDNLQYYNRNIRTERSANAHNLGFRLEWKIDNNTTLVVDPDLSYGDFASGTDNDYSKSRALGDTVSRGYTRPSASGKNLTGNAKITVSRKLKKKGRTVSINLRGNFNNTETDGKDKSFDLKYRNGLPGARTDDSVSVDRKYTDDITEKGNYIRLSYVEPVGKNNRLELSLTRRLNISDADRMAYDFLPEWDRYADTVASDNSYRMQSSFTNYQIGLNFKRYQKKYRYTVGIKAEPSDINSVYIPIVDDDQEQSVTKRTFNIAPSANFVYNFHKKKYLKIVYNGYTTQPAVTQLQPKPNNSNPSFIRKGNPDLKPRFTQSLKATYSAYRSKDFSLLTANLNASFQTNAIVNKTEYIDESVQMSMPVNVNGVYNIFGNVLFNKPLFGNRLTVNTNTPFGINNSVGFTKADNQKEYLKNNTKRVRVGERLKAMYQNHFMELSAGGEISYVHTRNEVNDRQNSDIYDWEYFADVLFRLPLDITVSSDIVFSYKKGYMDSFNMDEIIWNAEIEKLVFKNKKGIVSLKVYDILKQRMSIVRSVGANYTDDSEYNTLKSYFLVCFAYKFDFWGR